MPTSFDITEANGETPPSTAMEGDSPRESMASTITASTDAAGSSMIKEPSSASLPTSSTKLFDNTGSSHCTQQPKMRKMTSNILISLLAILLPLIYASKPFLTGVIVFLEMAEQLESDYLEVSERFCPPTTNVLEDLVVPASLSYDEARHHTERHGAAIIRDVISNATLKATREMLIKANADVPGNGGLLILEQKNRLKVILSHREIGQLLNELSTHPILRPLLESLMGGPSASIIAMDAITAFPGALAQHFHRDTQNNSSQYVPVYVVVIPLQETTAAMGATGICPGTHECTNGPSISDASSFGATWESSLELQNEYETFEDWVDIELPFCPLKAETKAGDVFVYNSNMFHRGEAHVDPTAMDRIAIFLSFAESRAEPSDTRAVPPGNYYNMAWDSWGHTLDDLTRNDYWWPWESFGLFNAQRDGRVPWSIFDFFAVNWRDESESLMIFRTVNEGIITDESVEELELRAINVMKKTLVLYGLGLLGHHTILPMSVKMASSVNQGSAVNFGLCLVIVGISVGILAFSSGSSPQEFHAPVNSDQNSIAVLVTGAGSSDVNGCYLLNGRNGNAWQFELSNVEHTFEIFKVAGSGGWWNIVERVGHLYPNPVHYGALGKNDDVLPQRDGWGSIKYEGSWVGMAPMPEVEFTDRNTCVSWEGASSVLAKE